MVTLNPPLPTTAYIGQSRAGATHQLLAVSVWQALMTYAMMQLEIGIKRPLSLAQVNTYTNSWHLMLAERFLAVPKSLLLPARSKL